MTDVVSLEDLAGILVLMRNGDLLTIERVPGPPPHPESIAEPYPH